MDILVSYALELTHENDNPRPRWFAYINVMSWVTGGPMLLLNCSRCLFFASSTAVFDGYNLTTMII